MAQNSNYTEAADIYAIGITTLELGFNKTPFDGWEPLKILLCKLSYDCPMMVKPFSQMYYKFVQACLAKNRPTVHELCAMPLLDVKKKGILEVLNSLLSNPSHEVKC
jgi:serine/threonine protein kinase